MDCSRSFDGQTSRLAAGIFTLIILVLAGISEVYGQISPGELSKAHGSLNGPAHCADCHVAGTRPPAFSCLGCHREIRERLDEKRGLHFTLVGEDRTGRSCAKCHPDHYGPKFDMIHWDPPIQQFDHNKTGYILEGRHARATCRSCHQPKLIPASARKTILVKDLNRTYLGLSQSCSACHEDFHQGQLSMDCELCHNFNDWKKPSKFDHAQARFKLDKTHEKVPCDKCHRPADPSNSSIQYRGVPFEDCSPCHRDPHANAFKTDCNSCHDSLAGWKSTKASAVFRHSQTRFPLEGKHAATSCSGCHPNENFKQPLAFADCSDCHRKDPHRGQFADRAGGGDCDACHTVQGFKPSTFDAAQHNKTRFPLRERHLELQCADCHKPEPGGVIYRITDFSCAACHRDVHEAQFAGLPYRNRCESCHNEKAFIPSTYTAVQHNATPFALSGGHAAVACVDCHKPKPKPVKFRFENSACTVCHQDPHKNQFAGRMASVQPDGTVAGCRSCHTINSWHELDKFDHASTGFLLAGAHSEVPCGKCHMPADPAAGVKATDYKSASTQCIGCHDDPHKGQFASRMSVIGPGGNPAGCSSCHDQSSWHEMSRFDHSATKFPLEGAHREVTCAKCHKGEVAGADIDEINYAKTPLQCSGCHEDIHGGQFSSGAQEADCARCHKVEKWKPSTFDHDRQSSYKLEGAHRNVACNLCHVRTKEVAGKQAVIYKPTPSECSACHKFGNSTGN